LKPKKELSPQKPQESLLCLADALIKIKAGY
jgi:hypothetical protein